MARNLALNLQVGMCGWLAYEMGCKEVRRAG
jgi:hypothetical protein